MCLARLQIGLCRTASIFAAGCKNEIDNSDFIVSFKSLVWNMLLLTELEVYTRNYCILIEIRNKFFDLIG